MVVCTKIVQLSGAVGSNAAGINGLYEPIDEFVGNASVYKKLGDGVEYWIEYYAPTGKWIVRPTADRGTNRGYAYATISPPRALEDCPISTWQVYDGSSWVRQPSFSVAQVVINRCVQIHVLIEFVLIYMSMW